MLVKISCKERARLFLPFLSEEGKKYTQKGGSALCISCKNSIDNKTMTTDISKNKDRDMIAIQIQKKQRTRLCNPNTRR